MLGCLVDTLETSDVTPLLLLPSVHLSQGPGFMWGRPAKNVKRERREMLTQIFRLERGEDDARTRFCNVFIFH